MGVLRVVHGIIHRLAFGQLKVELERGVMAPHQVEETRGVAADLIDDLQSLVKKNAPESEVDAKLKEVVKAEREVIDVRQRFVEKLGDLLTKQQIARYIVFERNFNQDLRELMRESAQQRWRGRN